MNFVQPAKVQCSSFFRCQSIFGMLIPRKLHSQIESRNSWVFNRDSILPSTYLLPASLELDCQQGCEGGGAIASRSPILFPANTGDPVGRSAPWVVAHAKRRKTARGRGDWGSAMAIGPCQTPLDNRLTSRAYGHAKRWAAVGSSVPWCICRNTGWERDGGHDRRPAPGYGRPQACSRMQPDYRSTSQWSCFV